MRACCTLFLILLAASTHAETWMGLEVRPESRCSAYDRERDYQYSQSLEPAIAKRMGGIRCRYTGQSSKSRLISISLPTVAIFLLG